MMSESSLTVSAEEFEASLLAYQQMSSKLDVMEGILKAVCSVSNITRDQSVMVIKDNESLALRISRLEVTLHNLQEKNELKEKEDE